MWFDYVKQNEEGDGLENFQGCHGCMTWENRGKSKCKGVGTHRNFTDDVETFFNYLDTIISCEIKYQGEISLQIIQVTMMMKQWRT